MGLGKVMNTAASRLRSAGLWADITVRVSADLLAECDLEDAIQGKGRLWDQFGVMRNPEKRYLLVNVPGEETVVSGLHPRTKVILKRLRHLFGQSTGVLVMFCPGGPDLTDEEP